MNKTTRRRRPANDEHDQTRSARREMAGLIAVGAAAVTAAAILFLFSTRTGREARERFQDSDLRRRMQDTVQDTMQDTMEELQRLAGHGAAYVERKAGELRQAIGERAAMLEARLPKSR